MASLEDLLSELDDILADAHGKAFSRQQTVDVEAIKTVLEDIRLNVPTEIQQARVLASERREIINRANREADATISDAKIISKDLLEAAEKRSKDMDDETNRRTEELMQAAQQKARQLIEAAKAETDKIASEQNIVKEAGIKADQIKMQADLLLDDAKKEAQRIVDDAEYKSEEKMQAAEQWSHDVKLKAGKYVDEIVNDAEYRIGKSYAEIRKLQESLNSAARSSKQAKKDARRNKPAPIDISSGRTDYGMSEKQKANMARNAQGAYGTKKKSRYDDDSDDDKLITHSSLIDIPLDDFMGAVDDPPLHEKSNYNIEL